MLRILLHLAPSAFALLIVTGALAAECPPPTGSVRAMFHEPDVIANRLAFYDARDREATRAGALRSLFEAAGCPQIAELGDGARRNVLCTVPGGGAGAIVVGVSQTFDSPGSAALLSSLAESLAVAQRNHTFHWVAFSAHETWADKSQRAQKPKGASRWLEALTPAERANVRAMIHLGPMGFGPVWVHPPGADDRLRCPLEHAARAARLPLGSPDQLRRECGGGPGVVECEYNAHWQGGNDWQPFRRIEMPVFGIHTGNQRKLGGAQGGDAYFASYRMLIVFLALADQELARQSTASTP